MPIISPATRRNRKTRFACAMIFALLSLGALTMLYPFSLMLAGSVHSEADGQEIAPWPSFWTDDTALFRKYAESKHDASLDAIGEAWGEPVAGWRRIAEPAPVADAAALADWKEWRATPEAREIGILGHVTGGRLLPKNARLFRARLEASFAGDFQRFRRETGATAVGWTGVNPPVERIGRHANHASSPALLDAFRAFKRDAPPEDLRFPNPEAAFARSYLPSVHGQDVAALAAAWGTNLDSWAQVRLPRRAPPAGSPAREDWLAFVRNRAPLDCVRLDEAAAPAWQTFLAGRPAAAPSRDRPAATPSRGRGFPRLLADAPELRTDWEAFLRSEDCRPEWIEAYGPYERFLDWRAARGRSAAEVAATPPQGALAARADWEDCMAAKRALRREFTTRNYKHVLQFVAAHGNGIRNTAIYCALAVFVALLVNPLAAYALSRFKLPGTYQILLFCMATMAFPGEVSMIPSFLLLKRFPLLPLGAAVAAMTVAWLLASRFPRDPRRRLPSGFRGLVALLAACAAGGLSAWALGPARATTSLLNTFAALVLPGAANGYFIFLLKGFFDSLPRELFEAAELDGAGEWTKFWHLAMNLSKPILAVIALGAFTGAYGAFMMALVIIPDESMWTLMVWISQLQAGANGAVVYASLVIAALPTFLVFALCQNVIIRGIVVPTEK